MERFIDDHGYVRVFRPDHPNNVGGYILEHRLLVEEFIGRLLLPSEVIHHINEVKTDNRLGNLYLCTPEEHVRIHNRARTFSRERRNNIRDGVRDYQRKKRKNKKVPDDQRP